MRSRVELFAAIRHDHRYEGLSKRALSRKYRVHRRTVEAALESPIPPERKVPVRAAPARESFAALVDAILIKDCGVPVKQRHTARRIWERLVDEYGVAVSYSYVAKYVHRRRGEIEAERRAGAGVVGFVPQVHEPGAEAEVDFCDVWITLAGVVTKCFMFTFRLSCSGKGIHRVFATQGQEAFFEGHVIALEAIGGVPGRIRYDNLRSAVKRVLFGRSREESRRWIAFRSHYGFEAFYCISGKEGAHEKGGVEGDLGRFRRRFLVPMPRVDSLTELNAYLQQCDVRDGERHIEFRTATVGADFAAEQPYLASLPGEAFDTRLHLSVRVDRYARVTVRQCRYSVPAYLIGARVRAACSASVVEVFDASVRVASHPRLTTRGDERLVLDHYLEILKAKPGALAGSVPLATARAEGLFTADHEAFWARARAMHGEAAGTRALIEVLLLHRRYPRSAVLAGIRAAVAAGSTSPDLVAIEIRKHTAKAAPAACSRPDPAGQPAAAKVISMNSRRDRYPELPADIRPAPDVAAYDQLLDRIPDDGRGAEP